MFSAYFVFHCLNMFCVEKQVSEFLATHFGYLRELPVLATQFGDLQAASSYREVSRLSRNSPVAKPQSQVYLEALATHSQLACDSLAIHSRLTRDLRKFLRLNFTTRPVAKRPEIAF